jgi:hypothetical protein
VIRPDEQVVHAVGIDVAVAWSTWCSIIATVRHAVEIYVREGSVKDLAVVHDAIAVAVG